jgi:hypothetical protein
LIRLAHPHGRVQTTWSFRRTTTGTRAVSSFARRASQRFFQSSAALDGMLEMVETQQLEAFSKCPFVKFSISNAPP